MKYGNRPLVIPDPLLNRAPLLYLGIAFPPGIASQCPDLQPAGQVIETALINSIRPYFDLRSVGLNEADLTQIRGPRDDSPGLDHDLNLLEGPPKLWSWLRSIHRLRRTYHEWLASGWIPDVILVRNFSPVYNAFVREIARQKHRPRLALYMGDSNTLGIKLPTWKRFRYRFKPYRWSDDDMIDCYDGCASVGQATERHFRQRNISWVWQPNGINPDRTRDPQAGPRDGPLVFGAFGRLAEHTGIPALLRFWSNHRPGAQLRICGYGKERNSLEKNYSQLPGVSFTGPLTPDQCLDFSLQCDVLVNPRPMLPENANNFSSKVVEYALTGRSILTTRLSGVDTLLGDSAFYFDAENFDASLSIKLKQVLMTPREELRRRGTNIQKRLLNSFSLERQGRKLTEFLNGLKGVGQ